MSSDLQAPILHIFSISNENPSIHPPHCNFIISLTILFIIYSFNLSFPQSFLVPLTFQRTFFLLDQEERDLISLITCQVIHPPDHLDIKVISCRDRLIGIYMNKMSPMVESIVS